MPTDRDTTGPRPPEGSAAALAAGSLSPDRRLAGLLHRLDGLRRVQQAQTDLGAADQRLMWLFQDRRPRTLREIAEELALEQSTVNRQVNAALAAGLVRRFRDESRSARLVTATEAGLQRFEADLTRLLDGYDVALSALGPTKSNRLLRDLAVFVDSYEAVLTGDL